jgi:uncharacterized protein YxjI
MTTSLSRYEPRFVARKNLFSFLGATFRIMTHTGELRFFVKQKAFKLKEDITVFADEEQTQAMLRIRARSVLDFGATYDVVDASSGEKVGACRRQGIRSMFKDTWDILSPGDELLASVVEDSWMIALLRRLLLPILPQTFHVQVKEGEGVKNVAQIRQRFTLFALTYDVDFSGSSLDPRLAVAMTVLLLAIEGRQQ